MGVFSTITRWAGDAWRGLTGVVGDVEGALEALWSFVSSIGAGLSWLLTALLGPGVAIIFEELHALNDVTRALRDAINRAEWWIRVYLVEPLRQDLLFRLAMFEALTLAKFQALTNLVYILHLVEERYTEQLVGEERQQRVAAVNAARAYALALTNQLHQTIEQEAVAGYQAGQGIRTTLLQQIANDLHVRGILDTAATKILVGAIDTLLTVEDPVIAAVANRLISQIVRASGAGQALGDLVDRLLFPGSGGAHPKDLTGVVSDIVHRIGQIEDWISAFMLDGGPEVEDAGRQWKSINSLVFDAAILAFYGQAVTSPNTWATEVADTAGVVANAAIGSIIDLINHV